jgi:6-phosphogluconolactonase (cycloisomerase 2 family)
LLAFPVELSSGTLGAPVSNTGPTGGSYGVVASPSGKYLYVSDSQAGAIDAFSINAETGALTPTTGSPFALGHPLGSTTGSLAIDPEGTFLYATDINAGVVVGFSVNSSTGALTPLSGEPETGSDPLGAAVDPSGRFLYVANTADPDGSISAYTINPNSGALTPVPGSPFPTVSGGGPQFLVLHPSRKFLYVGLPGFSTGTNLIGAYEIGANGGLTRVAGSPYATGSYPLGIAIDTAGTVLYVANSLDGTISAFHIDSNSGELTEMSGSPFSAGTNSNGLSRCVFDLRVDPGGKVLYSGDACNPAMLSFAIDSVGAPSTPVVTDTAGASSTFLAFVQVP